MIQYKLPPESRVLRVPVERFFFYPGRLQQRGFDGREHELDEDRGFAGVVGSIDRSVILPLPVMDDRLHREPDKQRISLGQKPRVPQSSDPPASESFLKRKWEGDHAPLPIWCR